MTWIKLLNDHSALASALDIVGDRWSLMIISGCMTSVRRFNELERYLGINRNLLSGRLDKLIKAGVIEKRKYQGKPTRYEYVITPVGMELRPVLVGLTSWSEKHLTKDSTPISMVHDVCGSKLNTHVFCPECEQTVANANVISKLNEGAGSEAVRVFNERQAGAIRTQK